LHLGIFEYEKLIVLLLTISIYSTALAQNQSEKKVAATGKELVEKVALLDSSLFAAYNSKNIDLMKPILLLTLNGIKIMVV